MDDYKGSKKIETRHAASLHISISIFCKLQILFVWVGNHNIIAIFATIGALILIHKVEHVVKIGLYGGHATRVLATDNVGHLCRNLQFHLLDGLPVLNDVDCGIRIDKSEEVVVNIDDVIDFDNVLLAHFLAIGVHDEGHVVFGLVEVQIVEHRDAVSCLDVVDDNTFFYTIDF